jgi:hypothetical protein
VGPGAQGQLLPLAQREAGGISILTEPDLILAAHRVGILTVTLPDEKSEIRVESLAQDHTVTYSARALSIWPRNMLPTRTEKLRKGSPGSEVRFTRTTGSCSIRLPYTCSREVSPRSH